MKKSTKVNDINISIGLYNQLKSANIEDLKELSQIKESYAPITKSYIPELIKVMADNGISFKTYYTKTVRGYTFVMLDGFKVSRGLTQSDAHDLINKLNSIVKFR